MADLTNTISTTSIIPMHDYVYAVEGEQTRESIAKLVDCGIQSVLFVCKDTSTDNCFPGGYMALVKHFFNGRGEHIPLDPSLPEFQPNGRLEFPWQAVLAYKKFEFALDRLALPTVIICKSARRASAVYLAHKAVTQHLTKEQAHLVAQQEGLTFVASLGLTQWVDRVITSLSRLPKLFIRQLFDVKTCKYTYLLAECTTNDAVLIDPVVGMLERDCTLIDELGFNLLYVIHTQDTTESFTISKALMERYQTCRLVCSQVTTTTETESAAVAVQEYDEIIFGGRKLYVLGNMTLVLDDLSAVFTGYNLLIRGTNSSDVGVREKLYNLLPDHCVVYPGEDTWGRQQSTIGEEKRFYYNDGMSTTTKK